MIDYRSKLEIEHYGNKIFLAYQDKGQIKVSLIQREKISAYWQHVVDFEFLPDNITIVLVYNDTMNLPEHRWLAKQAARFCWYNNLQTYGKTPCYR